MSTIDQLSALDDLAAGDALAVYSRANGDARRVSLSALANWLQSTEQLGDSFVTQYAAPGASGFTVSITPGADTWLILTPLAGYAAGTVALPPVATCVDRQEALVNTTQAVTTLTVDAGTGGSVVGAPATLAAGAFFRLKFDAVLKTWYRVG